MQEAKEKSRNRKNDAALKGEWSTPQGFFDQLDKEFHFTLDACASRYNAKCRRYFTVEVDGLEQSWEGEAVFCCPPSGHGIFGRWLQKAGQEAREHGVTSVLLLPSSTDSKWFHRYILGQDGVTLRFLDRRLRFSNPCVPSWVTSNMKKENSAMRASVVVVFRADCGPFATERMEVLDDGK